MDITEWKAAPKSPLQKINFPFKSID